MTSNPSGGQRGPLSDPRHGKARGEVIRGDRRGSSVVRQVAFVFLVLLGAVSLFVLAAGLLSDSPTGDSTLRTVSIVVLAVLVLLVVARALRRRANRKSIADSLTDLRSDDHR